jgi:hypothetical protein
MWCCIRWRNKNIQIPSQNLHLLVLIVIIIVIVWCVVCRMISCRKVMIAMFLFSDVSSWDHILVRMVCQNEDCILTVIPCSMYYDFQCRFCVPLISMWLYWFCTVHECACFEIASNFYVLLCLDDVCPDNVRKCIVVVHFAFYKHG